MVGRLRDRFSLLMPASRKLSRDQNLWNDIDIHKQLMTPELFQNGFG